MKSAKRQFIEKYCKAYCDNGLGDLLEKELLEAIKKDDRIESIDFGKWLMDNATPSDVSIEQFYDQYINQK